MKYRKRCYSVFFSPYTEEDLELERKWYKTLIIDKILPPDKNAKILDLGCGYGPFLYTLQKEGYTNSLGIDINIDLLETGKRFGVRNVFRMDLVNFLKQEQNRNSFDVITAFDVIEHFTKDEILDILDNIYKNLRFNGLFIMKTPCAESLKGLATRYSDFTHEIAFTRRSALELFTTIGFKKIRVFPDKIIHYNLKMVIGWILQTAIAKMFRADRWMFSQNLIAVGYKCKE